MSNNASVMAKVAENVEPNPMNRVAELAEHLSERLNDLYNIVNTSVLQPQFLPFSVVRQHCINSMHHDNGNLHQAYLANVAMLMVDRHGVDHEQANKIATDIMELMFPKAEAKPLPTNIESTPARKILHIQVGSPDWNPTADDLEDIATAFKQAQNSPHGEAVATNANVVKVTEADEAIVTKAEFSFENAIKKFNDMYRMPGSDTPTLDIGMPLVQRLLDFKSILGKELDEIDDIIEKAVHFTNNNSDFSKIEILTDLADLLGDLQVFCASEMRKFGLPLNTVLSTIMDSNFSKMGADGKPIYDEQNKLQKGPNYWKPEPKIAGHLALLMEQSKN